MPVLTSFRLRLLLAGGLGTAAADPGTPLRVLRSSPSQDAAPTAAITVTFDRPVAGSLDHTVDPRQILAIQPRVAGRAEWRDPVTLRFRPSAPFAPSATYRVTVSDRFEAMDGSRLAGPYTFAFRVRGPRVLSGVPVGPDRHARFLTPAPAFELVLDAPVESGVLDRALYLELDKRCSSPGVVRLRAGSPRTVTDKDRPEFREAGGWDRDRAADSLRRVVRLVPERELPRGCAGHLVVPASLDERGRDSLQRWPFSTYGAFQVVKAACGWDRDRCPTGPLVVTFSTPVKGAEIQRHLRLTPEVPFTVSDSAEERDQWSLEAELSPRTWYGVVADSALHDIFGQRLTGNPVATARTSGYAPAIDYAWGRAIVERKGPRTLAVTHVNVDTLEVLVAPVPDSLERELMARSEWQWAELWPALLPGARRRRVPVAGTTDRVGIYGVPLPEPAPGTRGATLFAVQVTSPGFDSVGRRSRPIALLQVTDLGAHARIGASDGAVWVTGASDGLPRGGATVTLHDPTGAVLAAAKTGPDGVARFSAIRRPPLKADEPEDYNRAEGYVAVALGGDRTLIPLNRYDPDLSPWRFNVSGAWGSTRLPVAGAVFTERGIYRPGERVYAKSIVRTGTLGSLAVPARGDSLRWVFYDRSGDAPERGRLLEKTVGLSAFGTAQASLVVPTAAGLGTYEVAIELRREGKWTEIASAWYRVAEYRPPEFLVDVSADSGARFAGDSVRATVDARYLFGAPMGRAAVTWTVRQQSDGGGPSIPGADSFVIGDTGWWWEEMDGSTSPVQVTASGTDTLDAAGRLVLRVPLGRLEKGRTGFATFEATVRDVNRQTVSGSAGVVVHPAGFYLGAKPAGEDYFWTAGTPVTVGVIAVRPDGRREHGVKVTGTIVRREWHQVLREREGYGEATGEWVSDTVARCALVTAAESVPCGFTPGAGGTYTVTFRATDSAGREAVTSFVRWTTGKDWVPWNDASQFKMDVIPDRTRYNVGDTATVLFASPFTNAEAWITIEREGLIQQRRLRITSGTTTLKLPITEALAPNAFVSIIVARGRSAAPGRVDDPGRPTIRVGYTDLRVTPERKRLTVAVKPARAEWRPGDTAEVRLTVRDSVRNRGVRSEVTLWAVDAGVLALTGYTTPDPLDLLYRPRGLGLRLASNLTTVAAQIPEGQKGKRSPGGGGGQDAADVLRSRFQTTAFFLGSVVTDTGGRAVARARLPDNLTTFRLMAVAVTAGDRYGKGESPLLVTRPLVARPALPRFLRDGDRFAAGVVVNRRSGAADRATVTATAAGVQLIGAETRTAELEPGRGREVRFDFRGLPGDSASFRFDARSGPDADAVRITLPVRSPYRPRAYTVAGVLQDTAGVEILLPPGIDPARSEVVVSLGTSPLTVIRAAERWLRVYPYWCTEQLSSGAQPLIALLKAGKRLRQDSLAGPRIRADLERVVATLLRRQREDGGIGIWSGTDWTTPWLSSYAGQVLLDARDLGIPVGDSALAKLGRYLQASLAQPPGVAVVPVARWWSDTTAALLSERLQALDYLSRSGRRDRAGENELLRMAPLLFWEDRVRLAWVFARGGDRTVARRLLEPAWASVTIEGRRATLPATSRRDFYFASVARPTAWLLSATLAVEPTHRLVGPLVESLIDQSRGAGWHWNTQDWGTTVTALSEFWARQRQAAARGVRVRSGGTPLFTFTAASDRSHDSTVSLARLPAGDRVRLAFETMAPGEPVYWYATLREVPKQAPVRPDDAGMQVERWYERLEDGKPVAGVTEGELVRVRLRITVPVERNFVILDDALPAGLEAVDLSLRTVGGVPGPGSADSAAQEPSGEGGGDGWPFRWAYGGWDAGWWTPFDHREIRDDRVVFFATTLWKGSYTATYVARATTPGTFVRPPAHAEEMYNPAVFGRSDGGVFEIRKAEEQNRR